MADFATDGYTIVRGAADQALVAAARADLAGRPPGPMVTVPVEDPFAVRLAGALAPIAAPMLGGDPNPFGVTYLVKQPGDGLHVLWHQDGHPWREQLGITAAVTVWLALDPVSAANGGLKVIPGSHQRPLQPLEQRDDPPNIFGWGIEVDGADVVDVELDTGDASIHHPALIHGSPPNDSAHPRRAVAVRFRL